MGIFNKLLVIALCGNFAVGENVYRVGVISSDEGFSSYTSLIQEASLKKADILVISAPKDSKDGSFTRTENYYEIRKSISAAAKQFGMYVVAQLYERARCQRATEIIKSNLVFDRQGSIVAAYRKPVNSLANCTMSSGVQSFSTDIGVTFGLLMAEDLVVKSPEELKMKNLIVIGGLQKEIPFLRGSHLFSSWSYVSNANLITPGAIFAGRGGLKTAPGKVAVVQLRKEGGADSAFFNAPATQGFPSVDLSQYIMRPLDEQASIRGYTETVCHETFCCQFYVKTSSVGSPSGVSYALAAFDGVHPYNTHHIGAQSCSIVCAGPYERSCGLGPDNAINTFFERIEIGGHFSKKNSAQFPVLISSSAAENVDFNQEKYENTNKVTISIEDAKNVLNFGIFGRVYSRDFEYKNSYLINERFTENYYDYFFNEDVIEFFDYLWIRVKILTFIVSIYVLEMM